MHFPIRDHPVNSYSFPVSNSFNSLSYLLLTYTFDLHFQTNLTFTWHIFINFNSLTGYGFYTFMVYQGEESVLLSSFLPRPHFQIRRTAVVLISHPRTFGLSRNSKSCSTLFSTTFGLVVTVCSSHERCVKNDLFLSK